MAPREAARGNARPSPPSPGGRGTRNGGETRERAWRERQVGGGEGRARTLTDIFRDIARRTPRADEAGDRDGWTAATEPVTEEESSARASDRELLCLATFNIADGRCGGLESAGRALEAGGVDVAIV